MATVKKALGGWVVISELTGQPLTNQVFKNRNRAMQVASEMYRIDSSW
jgi:hypothetical protein